MKKKKSSKGIVVILVVIIIILLALVVLMGTGYFKNYTSTNNNSKKETKDNLVSQKSSVKKSQILSYYKEEISTFTDSNHKCSIVDINNDDIPELFIYVTGILGNEKVADTSIFTYDENKGDKAANYIVYVGNVSGDLDNNTVLYKMNDGRLLSVFGHMGYEISSYYKLENDWLIRTEFLTKQTTDDYLSGDNEIKFKSCTDTSLIENFN